MSSRLGPTPRGVSLDDALSALTGFGRWIEQTRSIPPTTSPEVMQLELAAKALTDTEAAEVSTILMAAVKASQLLEDATGAACTAASERVVFMVNTLTGPEGTVQRLREVHKMEADASAVESLVRDVLEPGANAVQLARQANGLAGTLTVRGRPNEAADVQHVADELASLQHSSLFVAAQQLKQQALSLEKHELAVEAAALNKLSDGLLSTNVDHTAAYDAARQLQEQLQSRPETEHAAQALGEAVHALRLLEPKSNRPSNEYREKKERGQSKPPEYYVEQLNRVLDGESEISPEVLVHELAQQMTLLAAQSPARIWDWVDAFLAIQGAQAVINLLGALDTGELELSLQSCGDVLEVLYLCLGESKLLLEWLRSTQSAVSLLVKHCCFNLIPSDPSLNIFSYGTQHSSSDGKQTGSDNALGKHSHDATSRPARACNLLFALAYDHELTGHSKVVEAFRVCAGGESQPLFAPLIQCLDSTLHSVNDKNACMKLVNALVTPADGAGQFTLKQRMAMRAHFTAQDVEGVFERMVAQHRFESKHRAAFEFLTRLVGLYRDRAVADRAEFFSEFQVGLIADIDDKSLIDFAAKIEALGVQVTKAGGEQQAKREIMKRAIDAANLGGSALNAKAELERRAAVERADDLELRLKIEHRKRMAAMVKLAAARIGSGDTMGRFSGNSLAVSTAKCLQAASSEGAENRAGQMMQTPGSRIKSVMHQMRAVGMENEADRLDTIRQAMLKDGSEDEMKDLAKQATALADEVKGLGMVDIATEVSSAANKMLKAASAAKRLAKTHNSNADISAASMHRLLGVSEALKHAGNMTLADRVQELAADAAKHDTDYDYVAAEMASMAGVLEHLGESELASQAKDTVQELLQASNLQLGRLFQGHA